MFLYLPKCLEKQNSSIQNAHLQGNERFGTIAVPGIPKGCVREKKRAVLFGFNVRRVGATVRSVSYELPVKR